MSLSFAFRSTPVNLETSGFILAVAGCAGRGRSPVRKACNFSLCKAGLRVEGMNDLLPALRRDYEIGRLEFAKLLEPVGSKLPGQISEGTNRQGEDFLTVYYEN